jgi:hypothetical protein
MTISEFVALRQRAVGRFEQNCRVSLKIVDTQFDKSLLEIALAGYREGFDEAFRLMESGPDNWPNLDALTPCQTNYRTEEGQAL